MTMSTGGWCAPTAIEPRPVDLAEYWRRWPVGGPCSRCEGTKTITDGPACQCPLCEGDEEIRMCWGCDGTGIEQEQTDPASVGRASLDLLPELPVVSVRRGGIRWSGI